MPLERQPPPIANEIADGIGLTPMVRLAHPNKVQLLGKLELANPTGSVKDRIAKHLLEAYGDKQTLIIPTSGNLGLAIASLAAKKRKQQHKRVLTIVPERTSNDRIQMLKALGAEIIRSPNEARPDAPESPYALAAKLAEQLPNAIVLDETKVTKNCYEDLAEEILQQTKLEFDFLFVGAESGATVSGLAKVLKAKMPNIKIMGVEPANSVLASTDNKHQHHFLDWRIEDIGNNFVPQSLDRGAVDTWFKVSDRDAFSAARRLIRNEGIMCGPSSGAVVAAAIQHANTMEQNPTTHEYRSVVILNDSAKNYTSTLLNDEWLLENNLADDIIAQELEFLSTDRYRAASVEDLQLPAAVTIPPTATASYALDVMLEREFSQLPVIRTDNKKLVGYVSLASLQECFEHGTIQPNTAVELCMFSFKKKGSSTSKYQIITPDTSLADLAKFFDKNSFAVVTDINRKWCLGVATKYDLISFLNRRQFM
ncbi:tryptophan synthase beta subunit-like PLP-dependent enzyme [Zychaea mexicana]|uniref:tryptophan synthase beta subunit-like PLP-dependent enzyme n=1 Tax=Zychaea mexicana TaxID=64656 RepID=UPI0022FE0BAF|nr:tryptophan synthase beta subunit-like PLP-dependent enzyme [Zychaea mexicana]KAI9491864.1 tryptophan synthase beta subunit-like PLP-dependent enzyme [Zychaea mexicana]